MHTLIAVPDDAVRRKLAELAGARDHRVEEAADAAGARERIDAAPPDLLVVDRDLPPDGGMALVRSLRAGALLEVPVTLLVADAHDPDAVEATFDDGVYDWISRPVTPEDARARLAVGERRVVELAELRRTEERLFHDALHDGLTDLRNRQYLVEQLKHALARATRFPDELFAVLVLDLDRFKIVNDSLGHGAGDELLLEASRRVARCVREVDTVARLGGDEFAILLEEIGDISDAVRVAERIQEALSRPLEVAGEAVFTSASIGISQSASGYDGAGELLRDADVAMHHAKEAGGACYRMFDPDMHERAVRRLRLEAEVRRAVEREEFVLHYQPIVSLPDRAVRGFEALVRWNHPERELVSPPEFIGVAEETGIILTLGDWILGEGCRQLGEWHEGFSREPPLSLSVNLSAKQFDEAGLMETLNERLGDLPVGSVHLEVTETALMENIVATSEALARLGRVNFQLHIDDFGTGYSSLSYLHRLPVDSLKIDRSFVEDLALDPENREIVGAIVSLAHALDLEVIAEGVETEAQAAELVALGCDFGQGFHFGRPMTADAAGALLDEPVQRA